MVTSSQLKNINRRRKIAGLPAIDSRGKTSIPSPTPSSNGSSGRVIIRDGKSFIVPMREFKELERRGKTGGAVLTIYQQRQEEQQRQAEQQRIQQASQSRLQQIKTGGYFVDPATGLGYSSREDLTRQGYRRTSPVSQWERKTNKPTPLSVTDYTDEEPKIYKQTWKESAKQFVTDLGYNIKQFFTGKDHKRKDILEPFEHSGKLKKEQIGQRGGTYLEPQFGTISTDYPSGMKEVTIEQKTYGQLQEEIEAKRDILLALFEKEFQKSIERDQRDIQEKINLGLPFEKGKEIFKERTKESQEKYISEATRVHEKYPDIPNLYVRSGSRMKSIIPTATDIIVATGLSIGGSPMASGGYLAFRAVQKGAKKPTRKEAFLDIAEAWDDVLAGREVKDSPLVMEYKGYRKEAVSYLLFAGVSFASGIGKIGKEIDVLRFKEGIASPSKTIGKHYDINKQKWVRTITRQKTSYYKLRTQIDVPLYSKVGRKFSIGVGRGTHKVEFLPFTGQVGDTGGKTAKISFVVAGRGQIDDIIMGGIKLPPKYKATLGEGYVTPTKITLEKEVYRKLQAQVTGLRGQIDVTSPFGKKIRMIEEVYKKPSGYSKDFTFAGISEDVGKAYKGYGGRITSQRIYGELGGQITLIDDVITIPLRTTAKIPLKDTSIIFKKTPYIPKEFIDDLGISVSKVGRKSSKQFLSQLYKQESLPDLGSFGSEASSELRLISTKILSPKLSSPKLILAPSIFSGRGQYERTTPQFTAPIMDTSLTNIQSSIVQPRTGIMIKSILDTSLASKSVSKQRTRLISNLGQENLIRQTQILRQGLVVRQITKQKQLTVQRFSPLVNINLSIPVSLPPIGDGGGGFGFWWGREQRRKPMSKIVPTFSVQVRRRGKFRPIGIGLSLREAMQLGTRRTRTTLARTFKIVKTGKKKKVRRGDLGFFEPSLKTFRGYKIKKGRKEPLAFGTFIQKAPFALGTRGETKEIQRLRREQRELNKLINM